MAVPTDLGVDIPQPLNFTDSVVNSGPAEGQFGTYGFLTQAAGALAAGFGDILGAQRQAGALQTQATLAGLNAQENRNRVVTQQRQIGVQRSTALLDSAIQYHALAGLQGAAYSSQDVRINSGTAAETGLTEGQMGALNALTLKNNAVLQAWGVETQTNETVNQEMMQQLGYKAEAAQQPWLGFEAATNEAMTVAEESERTKAMYAGRI